MRRLIAITVLSLFAPAAVAQSGASRITVLEVDTAGRASIIAYDESSPGTAASTLLADVMIEPIEFTNRTELAAFDPSRPRLGSRAGAPTLELPGGGRILSYSRNGGTRWGFLLVTPRGAPHVLHELPGIGPTGSASPYEARIGIAGDGRHASFATLAGQLYLARLDGGDWPSSGSPTRPIPLPPGVLVEPLGMVVGSTSLFFVTDDDRIRRCALADGSVPQDLTPAGGPRMKDELAISGDGSRIVFLYGPRDLYTIFLLGDQGPAHALPPRPAKYEEPGYLPDVAGGPELLLDAAGQKLLYTDATIRDEIYLLDIASGAITHVTSDPNFQPYIGIGILPSIDGGELVLAVGDPIGFDWYAATTSTNVVRNLTRTNAQPRPFDVGTLLPNSGFRAGNGAIVSFEAAGPGVLRARRIDPTAGTSAIVASSVRGTPALGDSFTGAGIVTVSGALGDTLIDRATGSPRLIGPPGVLLSTEIIGPGGAYGMFVARPVSNPALSVPILEIFGVALIGLPAESGLAQVVLTRGGGAVLNGTTMRYLGGGRVTPMPSSAATRVVLSGTSN